MQTVAIITLLFGAAFASPAKLDHLARSGNDHSGYNYVPPAIPSGLYDVPETTTATTQPPPVEHEGYVYNPPKEPSGLYEAFASPAKLDHLARSGNDHSGYNYVPPAIPSGLYEVPETTSTTTQPPQVEHVGYVYNLPKELSGLYEAFASPAKLDHLARSGNDHSGYNYVPPAIPSGLYDVPETTTATTQPPPVEHEGYVYNPPKEPSGLYEAFASPAKLDHLARSGNDHSGYNYVPPAIPSGLYEVPETTSTTTQPPQVEHVGYVYNPPKEPSGLYETPETTTTTTTPPPPPPNDYLPPSPSVENNEIVPPPMMLMPYAFNYNVDDSDSGNNYKHSVTSDGQYVSGEYSVLMADGRTQVVKFTSTPEDGYNAEVTYV